MHYSNFFRYFFIFFLFGPLPLAGQEKLVGLEDNPAVINAFREQRIQQKRLLLQDTLKLPFFDDFSRESVFPSPERWEDKDIFVNYDYALSPPSVGMATFDILDASGHIYSRASRFSFVADYLTSKPIDLDLPVGSGVFLSFYFQPKGLGDPPEVHDSLKLEFYSPADTAWIPVWSTPGDTLPVDTTRKFRQVMIPVDDPRFLVKGFRFRFYNLASLSSDNSDPGRITNCDHWNIDYVLLDKDRFASDTIPHDVVVAKPLHSLLKNYEAMPWKQFRKVYLSEMGSFLTLSYTNLDSITRNVTRNFEIFDVYENVMAHEYTGGAFNINAWETINYPSQPLYTYQSPGEDSAMFKITATLVTDIFDRKINDTVTFYQKFNDYFAYDDGTSEAGYGYSGAGASNVNIACRFTSNIPDTLQAIAIYFNRSYQDANDAWFHLTVWDEQDGLPGNIIYSDEYRKPEYVDSLNAFYPYYLNSPVPVEGNFYVGWQQTQDIFMNIGFDLNRNSSDRLFYQENGVWYGTKWNGALMIRPVIGTRIITSLSKLKDSELFTIYPNPVGDLLFLKLKSPKVQPDFSIKILDIYGRMYKRFDKPASSVNVSDLVPGLYFLELHNGDRLQRLKFIKN